MTDVLNRPECFHCGRPVRWEGSKKVCRECHSKWGEPTIEEEMHAEKGDEEGEGQKVTYDSEIGVVTDTSNTVVGEVQFDHGWEIVTCPNCSLKYLTTGDASITECSDCETEWVPEGDGDD